MNYPFSVADHSFMLAVWLGCDRCNKWLNVKFHYFYVFTALFSLHSVRFSVSQAILLKWEEEQGSFISYNYKLHDIIIVIAPSSHHH